MDTLFQQALKAKEELQKLSWMLNQAYASPNFQENANKSEERFVAMQRYELELLLKNKFATQKRDEFDAEFFDAAKIVDKVLSE